MNKRKPLARHIDQAKHRKAAAALPTYKLQSSHRPTAPVLQRERNSVFKLSARRLQYSYDLAAISYPDLNVAVAIFELAVAVVCVAGFLATVAVQVVS